MRTVVRMANPARPWLVSVVASLDTSSTRPSCSPALSFVLDADGTITYAEIVPEITHEPAYEPALAALDAVLNSD